MDSQFYITNYKIEITNPQTGKTRRFYSLRPDPANAIERCEDETPVGSLPESSLDWIVKITDITTGKVVMDRKPEA
jgi:hypothetical protein